MTYCNTSKKGRRGGGARMKDQFVKRRKGFYCNYLFIFILFLFLYLYLYFFIICLFIYYYYFFFFGGGGGDLVLYEVVFKRYKRRYRGFKRGGGEALLGGRVIEIFKCSIITKLLTFYGHPM